MRWSLRWGCALTLAVTMAGATAATAVAAPSYHASSQGQTQSTANGDGGGSSGTGGGAADNPHAASDSSGSAGSASSSAPVGSTVAAAVYAARQAGESGTVVAYAIHQVLITEHPNAKGLAVAESVYSATYASGSPGASGGAPFGDVMTQAPWAASAIDALQQSGVVQGTSPTAFSPDAPVTLAQLAVMLARLQAGTAPSGVAAPAGTPAWALGAMEWAVGSGVLTGVGSLGPPDAPLTRAQAVMMLLNAAGAGQAASALAQVPIALTGAPPPWAHGAMALAVRLGLIQGSGGRLLADAPLTRAQMAVVLTRLAVLETTASAGG